MNRLVPILIEKYADFTFCFHVKYKPRLNTATSLCLQLIERLERVVKLI